MRNRYFTLMHPIIPKAYRAANYLAVLHWRYIADMLAEAYRAANYPTVLHWRYFTDLPAEALLLYLPIAVGAAPILIIILRLLPSSVAISDAANSTTTYQMLRLITLKLKVFLTIYLSNYFNKINKK